MLATRSIHAVDSHTMGEPTRIIVGGIPSLPGKTMAEKMAHLEEHEHSLITAVMREPRGHNDMFGAVLTTAVSEEADFGIIFIEGAGCLNMCGHGTIGAVTVAIETGIVPAREPTTEVAIDTPAGLVRGIARVAGGKVKEVAVLNVPSFLYKRDVKCTVPGIGEMTFDISFGGNFFAIINADQFGLRVEPKNASALTGMALRLRDVINQTVEVQHPALSHIRGVPIIEIYDQAAPGADARNVVIFAEGSVDRSPCGTGTSAKMATLHARGKLAPGQLFTYESILGTRFKGRIVGTTQVAGHEAILPEITGAAYITGFNQMVIDPDDPLKHGFVLQ